MSRLRRPVTWSVLSLACTTFVASCSNSRTPNALDPSGSEAERIAGLWWLAFGVAAGVYLIVGGLVVYGSLRKGGKQLDERSRRNERIFIATGGVFVPFVILLCFAAVTVNATAHLRENAPGAIELTVTGKRWWWDVDYPAYGIRSANEIHLPVGQPVHIRLVSHDVIHSFWVPQLAGKEDLIPGQPNEITFTPRKRGRFLGLCAEYCGLEHSRMHFVVVRAERRGFHALGDAATADRPDAQQRVGGDRPAGLPARIMLGVPHRRGNARARKARSRPQQLRKSRRPSRRARSRTRPRTSPGGSHTRKMSSPGTSCPRCP